MTPNLAHLAVEAKDIFAQRFGRAAEWLVAAPGRVNLIGEHTDYNSGFVLPMAIDRHVILAAASAEHATTLYSTATEQVASIDLDDAKFEGWQAYVGGVLAECARLGFRVPHFDAIVHSNVPLGGGLSSSAALEVATATLVEAMSGKRLDATTKALLCQRAEHKYAGTPCGIMDQFTSVFGEPHALLLLDCRAKHFQHVPWPDEEVAVLICDSMVHHKLASGEYAKRRQQCADVCHALGVKSLRDVTLEDLTQRRRWLAEVLWRRARHVITENARVIAAARLIATSDWPQVGQLLYASHLSLRDDYQVSCRELDVLVQSAHGIGLEGGVFGARMTGGGFGGCTVNLIRRNCEDQITTKLKTVYRQTTGLDAACFTTPAVAGAAVLTI